MRIACPNCSTLYDVPDTLLGNAGRRLRCAQCNHGWRFTPEPKPEPEAEVATPAIGTPADTVPAPVSVPAPEVDEALGRRFGQPTDEEAKVAMQAALRQEELAHPYQDKTDLPEPMAPTEADRFADLVRAARNNEMELEPETAPMKLRSKKNISIAVPLLIVLILMVIVLERHALMHVFPGTVRLFHKLHLS